MIPIVQVIWEHSLYYFQNMTKWTRLYLFCDICEERKTQEMREKFPYEAIFQWWPIEKKAIGITGRNPNSEKGYDTRTSVVVAEYNTKLVLLFPS